MSASLRYRSVTSNPAQVEMTLRAEGPDVQSAITADCTNLNGCRVNERDWKRFVRFVGVGPECWEWTGAVTNHGYGHFTTAKRQWLAHRFMWTAVRGEIPIGMFVCHHCDNPRCVRIGHLALGTATDNMRDMVAKGRGFQRRLGRPRPGTAAAILARYGEDAC